MNMVFRILLVDPITQMLNEYIHMLGLEMLVRHLTDQHDQLSTCILNL